MSTKTPEQARLSSLKNFGICGFRSWSIPSLTEVLIDGYLIEEVEIVTPNLVDPSQPPDVKMEYYPLLYSVVGKKSHIERFFYYAKGEDIMVPRSNQTYHGGQAIRVRPFYYRESPEVKRNGLNKTDLELIPGTLEYRQIRHRPEIFQGLHTADTLQGYMLGVDQADAEQGFPRILTESVIPYLKEKWEPSWTAELTKAIKAQPGWVKELIGHNFAGYRVSIPKNGLLAMIQQLVLNGNLTISHPTLKAHGICPALMAI